MIQIGKIRPIYNLDKLKQLVRRPESRHITRECRKTAAQIGFASVEEIIDVVLTIGLNEFYKTMPSEKFPGTFQDVYHKNLSGVDLYIKLQEYPQGRAVVISFKLK